MAIEIERKFAVKDDSWRAAADGGKRFIQGYFSGGPNAPTMRIRVVDGSQAFLTIKGKPGGFARSEFEYEIPVNDATSMLFEFCGTRIVEKVRYLIPASNGLVWEVDEYFGQNQGLFTAEIELPSPDTAFEVPPWLGRELSGNRRYTNGFLSRNPWLGWSEEERAL